MMIWNENYILLLGMGVLGDFFLTKTTSVPCKHSRLVFSLLCFMLNPPLFISFCFKYTHLIFEFNMFVNFLKPRQNYLDTMQILTRL